MDPPIRRRKRKKGPCPEASAAKAKATSAEAAAEAPLPPPTVEEAAAKAPAPPPPALALLPPEVPMLGVDAEEVPRQEESEDEPQITGVRTVGPTVWTIPSGVPLTVRREVESWTMETATMPTTPSFFQSPAAAMITLHRDLTLRLEGHTAWQAPYFIRMVDDPETKHRKPEYWYRCKVCQKWLDVAHLQGQTHSTNMQAYMQEGNPHLTAERPLEAIPRNYRKACVEGYADLGLHRIAGEFRRIVEAERRRTEPKAKSRPKSPQAKASLGRSRRRRRRDRQSQRRRKHPPRRRRPKLQPTRLSTLLLLSLSGSLDLLIVSLSHVRLTFLGWLPGSPRNPWLLQRRRSCWRHLGRSWCRWRAPSSPRLVLLFDLHGRCRVRTGCCWANLRCRLRGRILLQPNTAAPESFRCFHYWRLRGLGLLHLAAGQSHSGTTATASAFSKLQLAGTETIGSPSGTCSSSSEACASSAQAEAWQYNIPEPPPVPRSSRSDSRDP